MRSQYLDLKTEEEPRARSGEAQLVARVIGFALDDLRIEPERLQRGLRLLAQQRKRPDCRRYSQPSANCAAEFQSALAFIFGTDSHFVWMAWGLGLDPEQVREQERRKLVARFGAEAVRALLEEVNK